jgi:long-chain acyl-CoA synthetase
MKGYYDRPEETRAAFWGDWFRSGDLGLIDPDGYLFIVDRIKDMIITGGENVYPREIEELIYTREEVEECSVVGLPDKEWGERVTALMTLKPGRTLDTDDLRQSLKSNLAPFKVPKEYKVVSSFPKSAAGKILKRELKKQLLDELDD